MTSSPKSNVLTILAYLGATWFLAAGLVGALSEVKQSTEVREVISTPTRFQGQVLVLEGIGRFGFESGTISQNRESSASASIAMNLEGLPDWIIKQIPFDAKVAAMGTFTYNENGGMGPMGVYNGELKNARIVKWPIAIEMLIFLILRLVPTFFALYLLKEGIRAYRETSPSP